MIVEGTNRQAESYVQSASKDMENSSPCLL
jgi:hypothetical protein